MPKIHGNQTNQSPPSSENLWWDGEMDPYFTDEIM